MASSFKKDNKVKLDLLTDVDMLLMLKKCIQGGIWNSVYRYAKTKNKCMKDYDKNEESLYIKYWDVNNLYGWAMFQKPLVNDFEWIKDTSQFNEDFIKKYNEQIQKGYFLEVEKKYPEKLHELHNDLPFLPKKMKKLKKLKSL